MVISQVMNAMTYNNLDKPTNTSEYTYMEDTSTKTSQLNDRVQQRHEWLAQVLKGANYRVESLTGDASFRSYHRVYINCIDDTTTEADNDSVNNPVNSLVNNHVNNSVVNNSVVYMLMDAPPEKESVESFVAVADLLAEWVNVPDIVAKEMTQGFLLLQDFGDVEFAHLIQDNSEDEVNAYYQKAIDTIHQMQRIDADNIQQQYALPDYSRDLLATEMALFSNWFLPYVGVQVGEEFDQQAQKQWQALCDYLLTSILDQPNVFVHRDYHSRNLMQDKANDEHLGVIDFQDAVMGAYTYDLVSLLRDAYVLWDEAQIEQWQQYFWQGVHPEVKQAKSWEAFCHDVMVMGVQRHLKVLGIFVRLSQRDGKDRYLADIPKVMNDMLIELDWLSQQGQTPAVSEFNTWLTEVVLPKYRQRFGLNSPK